MAADLSIWTEPKLPLVFTGENRELRLFLKNSKEEPRNIKLESRIFQVATSVAAPLGERKKWKEVSFEGGQTVVEKYPFALPAIRAATSFVLKFYEVGQVEEAGSISILAFPDDLLSDLKELGKTHLLAMFDEENFLTPDVLKDLEIRRVTSLEERAQSDKPVLLIAVAGKGMEFSRSAEDLAKWTAGVLWLRRANLRDSQELPIEIQRKGEVTMISAERTLFADLGESPVAQLNLARCLRKLLKESNL